MPFYSEICSSLNANCRFLGAKGTCSRPYYYECSHVMSRHSSDIFNATRAVMNNLRTLHQENMELKKLLLELKQNQK